MKRAASAVRLLVRAAGVTQILLGMLFWSGYASGLIPVHVLIGFVLVLGLWTLALLGLRGGAHRGLIAIASLWGLMVPVLGLTQEQLLPGAMHWIVQILHLIVGVGAMGIAEILASQTRQPSGAPA